MDMELLRANLVRTLVPIIVGALASMLPILSGFDEVATLIGFGVSAAYYAVFRIAETRYPWLGAFLGQRMIHDPTFANGANKVPSARAPIGVPSANALAFAAAANGTTSPEATVEVLTPDSASAAAVSLDGHRLAGVTSVAWTPHPDGSTLLNLRLKGADVTIGIATTPPLKARHPAPEQTDNGQGTAEGLVVT